MSWKNRVAIALCVAAFGLAFVLTDGAAQYLNGLGLVIVLSGTLGATFLSFPWTDIRAALQVARNTYRVKPPTSAEVVNALIALSVRSRYDGILALEEAEEQTTVTFLKNALGLMVDGYPQDEMRDILLSEMGFFEERRRQKERIFRHMATLAPAFGVTGSVVGLVGMVAGIGDPEVVLATIPIALTSTLYGVVLANFVLTPVAESIHFRTQHELLCQKLVIEGVSAIMEERNSYKLERKLLSFVTPAERPGNERSLEELRRKYHEIRQQEGVPLPVRYHPADVVGDSRLGRRGPDPREAPSATGTSPP